MIGNPEITRARGRSVGARCGDYRVYVAPHGAAHVDFPGAHAASGRGRTSEVNANPWVVLRRGGDTTVARWGSPTWKALEKRGFVEHNLHETEKGAKAEAYRLRGAQNPRRRKSLPAWQKRRCESCGAIPYSAAAAEEFEKITGDFFCPACAQRMERAYENRKHSRGREEENPRLMVLNPSANTILEKVERHIGRRLTSAERRNAEQAIREFKQFHGRDPETLIPVDAPPGSPLFLNYVGHETRRDYEVRIGSERKGRWTHAAGDHGRKHKTKPAIIASIPGRKKHNTLTVAPSGSHPFFKPTHGLMG